jgi:hypothetical protein
MDPKATRNPYVSQNNAVDPNSRSEKKCMEIVVNVALRLS